MIEIELKSEEEFQSLNLPEECEFLEMLEQKYPEIYCKAVEEEKQFLLEDGCRPVADDDLFKVIDIDDFLDTFEDLYFDAVGWESDEIIKNYYVKDAVGTDRGVWEMVVENGYVLIS